MPKFIFSNHRITHTLIPKPSLAYCELYLTLAAVFAPGRFSLRLFETDITDVETSHDFFNSSYRLDSKGVRVLVE
jgi:hypothetical protein